MWGDAKFGELSPLLPSGQALWIYLLTCPNQTVVPGLFVAGQLALAEALGWSAEAFADAFREVLSKGMVKADWKHRVVWVPNAIKYNPPQSVNVVKAWRNHLDEIPECPLKEEAVKALREWLEGNEAFAKAFGMPYPKPSGKPSPIQEQEQEQDQEQEQEQNPPPPPTGGSVRAEVVPSGFPEFWEAYPNKANRQAALRAWNKLAPGPDLVKTILEAIARQKTWPTWTEKGGQYVPHAANWLKDQRWEEQTDSRTHLFAGIKRWLNSQGGGNSIPPLSASPTAAPTDNSTPQGPPEEAS
jgi:hypothetical protein